MKQQIVDDGDPRLYWTQIPNIVFEIGLKPLELVLYAHLKRAAGASPNGKCFKSTATLARETGMGAGTVSRTKTALEARRHELGNRPLIRTKEVPNPRGGKAFQEITITDIWKVNTDRFSSSTVEGASSSVEVEAQNQVPVEVDPSSKPISTVEIKKNVEEEQEKKKSGDFVSDLKADPLYSRLDVGLECDKARAWAGANRRQFNKRFVVNWLNRSLERLPKDSNRDVWAGALTMKDLEARARA